MVESAADSHASASLPYGMLITWNLIYCGFDLLAYPVIEVSSTYDSKAFTSIGYVLIEKEWCKKESIKNRPETFEVIKIVPKSLFYADKETKEIKNMLTAIEETIASIKEPIVKLL